MAVALRGYTQGTSQAIGVASINWPAGTVAGDLAVVFARDDFRRNGPAGTGWTAFREGMWWKLVTTADIAAPISVYGKTTFLQTFSGASRIGEMRYYWGLRVQNAGGGIIVYGIGPSWMGTIAPGATDRLGSQVMNYSHEPQAVWFKPTASAGFTILSSFDWDASYYAYELIPAAAPNAPVVVSPASSSYVDAAQPVVFSWLHQSNSNTTQDGAQIRIRTVGSGTWSYVQAAGTITTTVTTLSQTAQSATINAGVLTAGQAYEYGIATREFGTLGTYSATATFTPANRPVVNSITPTSPAESLTPAIAWTETLGVGSQEAYQVRISNSTDPNSETPIWDSGVITGTALTTNAPATAPWTNGQAVYAWVRVLQTGGLWSPWTKDDATFAVTWTPPVAPATVVAANVADEPLQVTVTGINAGYDLAIEMSIDAGETWTPVRTLTNPGTPVTTKIPLAGYGIPTIYRARTSVTLSDVVVLYSSWVESAALASTDRRYYLVTEDGNSYLPVQVVQDNTHTIEQGISITYGHGATRARQDQTVSMGESGTTTLQASTLNEEHELTTWLTSTGTWWLRWGPERGPTLKDRPATLMALAAPVQSTRLAQFNVAHRNITFSWVEQ